MNAPHLFENEEEKLLAKTEDLYRALTHLRYEGKLFKEQNVQSVQILAFDLNLILERHRHLREKIVFPFLRKHIPRHEAAILILEAEHAEIENHQENLMADILGISSNSDPSQEIRIYEAGIYLITLIRHHIGLEKKSIDRSVQNELHEDERNVIRRLLSA